MITGVIMASGFSRRMKKDKLLMKLGKKTLIERAIETALESDLNEVIIVYRTDEVRDISDKFNIKKVFNTDASKGQSASIRLGISNASSNTRGIMFMVGDQPYLDKETINSLISEFEEGKIVIPLYDGVKGNPIIFPRHLFSELESLKGDTGGRDVVKNHIEKIKYVEIENLLAGKDMDTLEEYEKIKEDFK